MKRRGYFAECGLQNAESCQGVICGKSSAERSANYLIAFLHSTAEKFRISADCKTTIRLHCTTNVNLNLNLMHQWIHVIQTDNNGEES